MADTIGAARALRAIADALETAPAPAPADAPASAPLSEALARAVQDLQRKEEYLTPADVARMLRLTPRAFSRLARTPAFPRPARLASSRSHRLDRFLRSSIDSYMAGVASRAPAPYTAPSRPPAGRAGSDHQQTSPAHPRERKVLGVF